MSNWNSIQQQVQSARTQDEKRKALEALVNNIPAAHQDKQLVSLNKGGVNVVRLGDLPRVATENPQVYDRVRKIISRG